MCFKSPCTSERSLVLQTDVFSLHTIYSPVLAVVVVIVTAIIMGGELQVILDLLWCPVARASPSNAGVVGSILGWATKIPHAS